MKKYLQDKYLGLFFCIGFSIYFTYAFITKERIESAEDLIEVQGKLVDYSFKEGTGRKRMGHEYYMSLDGYSNQFQIKADYLDKSNAFEFVTLVRPGDNVTFTIPKIQFEKLNSTDKVFVTSIRINRRTYLDKRDVIENEKSYALLYGAAAFLILGFLVFKIRDRQAKTTANKMHKKWR